MIPSRDLVFSFLLNLNEHLAGYWPQPWKVRSTMLSWILRNLGTGQFANRGSVAYLTGCPNKHGRYTTRLYTWCISMKFYWRRLVYTQCQIKSCLWQVLHTIQPFISAAIKQLNELQKCLFLLLFLTSKKCA